MKIIFMGTPEFAVPSLKALHEKYEVVCVVSQPNRAKKKGQIIETPVAKAANELGLNLIQPEGIKDMSDYLINLKADMIVTAAYGQYVPTKILKSVKHAINVHGSLLPKHRGGAPIQRAILNGDKKTGVTIIEMVKKLDAGRMYSKVEYEIQPEDNSSTVFERLSILGRDLLMDTIEDVYNDINLGVEQNEAEATFSSNLLPIEERIDFNDTALDVVNRIRAFSMEVGAYILYNDVKLKVFKASIIDCDPNITPGTVIRIKKGIHIKCLDKAISLDLVLYPGKKLTTGEAFSNGQKLFNLNDVI